MTTIYLYSTMLVVFAWKPHAGINFVQMCTNVLMRQVGERIFWRNEKKQGSWQALYLVHEFMLFVSWRSEEQKKTRPYALH